MHAPGLQIKHHVWIDWAWIAVEHLGVAEAARADVVAHGAAGTGWGDSFSAESRAAMVTISAAAHALDALYGALNQMVTVPNLGQSAARHAYVRTSISLAHTIGLGNGRTTSRGCSVCATRLFTSTSPSVLQCLTQYQATVRPPLRTTASKLPAAQSICCSMS